MNREQKARQEIESVWQQRMDSYRNEITTKFNGLVESVASIQENKRIKEESFLHEIESYKNVIDNLKLENKSLKDQIECGKLTLDQFKENNTLLREKLIRKEEIVNKLQSTIKLGVEERNGLEQIICDLKKKSKKEGNVKNDQISEAMNKKMKKKESDVCVSECAASLDQLSTGFAVKNGGDHHSSKVRKQSEQNNYNKGRKSTSLKVWK